jgi:hypothetical protein
MVPASFTGYFTAVATAAAALIGLLFVAASLRPETVLGREAPPLARAMAGSAFTALVNSFFVSLDALIPSASLGYIAAIMAVISLYNTGKLHHQLPRHEIPAIQLLMSVLAFGIQLGVGVALVIRPHDTGLMDAVAYLIIASFAVALARAWLLMQGRHLPHDSD